MICHVWLTWKVDVAFARVAVADGRRAGVPDAPRRANHGLAEAPQTPAISKEPEESCNDDLENQTLVTDRLR